MSEPKPITTEAELQASGIEERDKAATPGPWMFKNGRDRDGDSCDLLVAEIGKAQEDEDPEYAEVFFSGELAGPELSANWEFTQHARQDIPLLVASLREFLRREAALRAEIERMLEVAKGFKGENGSTLADFLGSATQQAGENSEMERG